MLHRYRQLLPALVLAAFCFNTLITALRGTVLLDGNTYDFSLNAKHYSALIATVALITFYFIQRRYYKYGLLLVLGLGVSNLVSFTALETVWGVGIGPIKPGLSPVVLLFSLTVYVLNSSRINTWLLALIAPSEARIAQANRQLVEDFAERFARKSSDDLRQIVTENKLLPAAVQAAQQLLQQRQAEPLPSSSNQTNNKKGPLLA